jgi:hypothetical protein
MDAGKEALCYERDDASGNYHVLSIFNVDGFS